MTAAISGQNKHYDKDQVISIIHALLDKVENGKVGPSDQADDALLTQVRDLHAIIEQLRGEIAALSPSEIAETHIPTAHEQLEAVVEATEEATDAIMTACETLEALGSDNTPLTSDKIQEEVTKIYEACSFQDLTGQRIAKVAEALKSIEEKTSGMLGALQSRVPVPKIAEQDTIQNAKEDKDLMNGPALPSSGGVTQDDIDKILASF